MEVKMVQNGLKNKGTNAAQPTQVGSIVPEKIEPSKLAPSQIIGRIGSGQNDNFQETTLILAVRRLIGIHGIRKSAAAVRDAVSKPKKVFDVKQAISALSNLGFKSSFGNMRLSQLQQSFLPLIAFLKDGEAVIITELSGDDQFTILYPGQNNRVENISAEALQEIYSGFALLAKAFTRSENEERSGHWFFSAFKKSKWLYVQVMIAAMVSNFLSLTTSIFTMTVYDRIIPNAAFDSLVALTIGAGIALGFDFILKGLRAKFIDTASKKADLEISRKLFDRILSLTPAEQRTRTGAMAGKIKEFETLREFFNSSTLVVLIDLPFVFLFIYVIYIIGGPMAYVPLVCVPLVIIVGLSVQPILAKITRTGTDSGMNKQAVLVETLSGLETVNVTGSGKLMRQRYEDALNHQSDNFNRIRTLSTFIINFAGSIQQYGQIATIVFGVFLIMDGTITQGALIAAMILGGRAMSPLSQLANTLSRVNTALIAYKSLDKMLGKNSAAENMAPISRPKLMGEIEFKNVSFQFEGANSATLKNLSFKIPAGQKVAVVGKMGCGKSTISKLIAGILTPTSGSVLIDGIDTRQIDPSDLRKNVGIMLQDSWLFSGTIRENIQLSFNEYDDDYVLEICKVAGVDDFVGSHPNGYEMEIRERGVGLSGGQRQTINLARSLLHDPQVLLLDEPTSSMDQNTEKSVVDSLRKFCTDKTMLIITHRNPILTLVDRVFVMESGQIVADQTPEQLGIQKG